MAESEHLRRQNSDNLFSIRTLLPNIVSHPLCTHSFLITEGPEAVERLLSPHPWRVQRRKGLGCVSEISKANGQSYS